MQASKPADSSTSAQQRANNIKRSAISFTGDSRNNVVSPRHQRYLGHGTFNVRNVCHMPPLCLKHAEVAQKPAFQEGHLFSHMKMGFGGWLLFSGVEGNSPKCACFRRDWKHLRLLQAAFTYLHHTRLQDMLLIAAPATP